MNKINTAILALSCLKGIGLYRLNRLISPLVSSEISEDQKEIDFFDLIETGIQEQIFSPMLPISYFMEGYQEAENILELCEQRQICVATPFDKKFPILLKFENIVENRRECPPILFYQGDLSIFNKNKCVAMIGTRYPSDQGYQANESVARLLAQNNMTVVSGLAIGCDSAAHRGCLEINGNTAAFLPGPLDFILPSSNKQLAEKILSQGGCLLSEYPPQKKEFAVQKGNYIQRDRLQAMSSNAVVTSEFDRKSGTVHTIRYAHQYHKPIYALEDMVRFKRIPLDFFDEEGIALNLFQTPDEMVEQIKKTPIL
ncbi:DNA-processing protein DprA [Pseudoramibacter sp.]|jgi:DNA processing protein|uniref:DNA-processing protein DprA n=1 Tax=Pseudoramibacter sp. TaxID=2034862 RepID=UPI0025D8F03B|nr:DNA-processing protein DprA [Pseudoramibacter sp.]MCH4072923.1 DNA-protecting protein DprA [Pseudoramibacter sp.]MCH4106694.1 DNA-protecting protein DprA [Pseudoramibacter sp.]